MEALTRSLIARAKTVDLTFPSKELTLSAALHVGLLLALVFGPSLFGKGPQALSYVDVVLLPAADLTPGPQPQPEPERAPPPEPEPEPEPPPPEPEPEVPEDIPVLPSDGEEAESEPEPEPPAPVREPETPSADERSSGRERDPRLRPASTGSSQDSALAAFDDPSFVYSYYLDRMLSLIQQHWRKPQIGRQIECVLHFRIDSEGAVSELEVREASGLRSWDEAALRAVQSASPMQPLPRSYRKPSLGVTLVVRNSMRTAP